MCARTPIWCPDCGNTLLHKPGRAECPAGHVTDLDKLPIHAGQRIVTKYHASGRSQILALNPCDRCPN